MNLPEAPATEQTRVHLAAGCETMKQLLSGLLDSKGKVSEEIHAIRKLAKSLRGGFALFGLKKTSALEIQAIGRLLSNSRDACSRFNTWNKLDWKDDPTVSTAIGLLLEQQTHSAARRPPAETIAWCLARVDAALAELQRLPEKNLEALLTKGLEKLKKRALKRCRKLDHRSEENFHEARKAVKALLGAIGFLPEDTAPLDPQFQHLAELLGDENDLTTLARWLRQHGFTNRFAPDLCRTVDEARLKLQRRAIKDVGKLSLAVPS